MLGENAKRARTGTAKEKVTELIKDTGESKLEKEEKSAEAIKVNRHQVVLDGRHFEASAASVRRSVLAGVSEVLLYLSLLAFAGTVYLPYVSLRKVHAKYCQFSFSS